jgi:lycopene cyclase domain-containing protein
VIPDQFTYLALLVFSIAYPFAQSFEHRISLWKKWKNMIPSILITAIFFLAWDIYFTKIGVWSFNARYTLPFRLAGMPLEEWLFFCVVPYCCFFVYFIMDYYVPLKPNPKIETLISAFICLFFMVAAFIYIDKWYTSVACICSGILLSYLSFVRRINYLLKFWMGYLVCLIPFLIVNGILTEWPVVEYNDSENSGYRIAISGLANIPVEDLVYNFLLLLMNISLYEYFSSREQLNRAQPKS